MSTPHDKPVRKALILQEWIWVEIEKFRVENGYPTTMEAVRQLLMSALKLRKGK